VIRRVVTGVALACAGVLLVGSPAFAHECTNANKPPAAGAQVVIGPNDDLVSATRGVVKRIEKGIIDPESGEGFHGIVAFDFDGDGTADASTYIVGPTGEIPEQAQDNGSPDHGIVNICTLIPCE
jgi:hypothetical protein